jgi:hypothetical protein
VHQKIMRFVEDLLLRQEEAKRPVARKNPASVGKPKRTRMTRERLLVRRENVQGRQAIAGRGKTYPLDRIETKGTRIALIPLNGRNEQMAALKSDATAKVQSPPGESREQEKGLGR